MSDISPLKLRIPHQDLDQFGLFPLTVEGAEAWIRELPVIKTRETVQQLCEALEQLNRIVLPAAQRYAILEVLRPVLQAAVATLSRRFLNQPLVLPAEPQQIAELVDQLHGRASTGYTVVAIHAIRDREVIQDVNPARLTCEAVQRALWFTACRIVQTYQLHQPSDNAAWQRLHQLYMLAERQHLTRLRVDAAIAARTTITATYLIPLLLACCKPNQLRQSDLTALVRSLQQWSELATLEPDSITSGLFAVDIEGDQPPAYSSARRWPETAQLRVIDTAGLTEQLRELAATDRKHGSQGIVFDKDTVLHSNVLQHVIDSLSSVSMRNFNRSIIDQQLQVALGLSSTHYYTAGEQTFKQVLYGSHYQPTVSERIPDNPFLRPRKQPDPWEEVDTDDSIQRQEHSADSATTAPQEIEFDPTSKAALLASEDEEAAARARHPQFQVRAVNASPGGYCLEWDTALPGKIHSGDILCVREADNSNWIIASIRWISRLDGAHTMVGIELLSPRATPYGACILQPGGVASEPIRVLLLPEISLVGQLQTLVTPRNGFREGQKILLLRGGEEFKVKLQRQVAATAAFSQFEFRRLKQTELSDSSPEHNQPYLPFKSLWSDI
ncbi:RNA-binding protein [Kineobactrum salinum]|uniref:GTPase n=1 Tax=Kineobactrum salinum TaxID=2708301 RepID=A0A6C0U497_9GAMM|nr:GTPase [Kineobactrum salinum]QIB65817.1 GTPase [Kineobactrum salinum]